MDYLLELKKAFDNDDSFIVRQVINDGKVICNYAYINGISSPAKIGESIIKPLKFYKGGKVKDYILDGKIDEIDSINKAILTILKGDCVVISDEVIGVDTKANLSRGITEPNNDKSLKGSKEGFVENILVNTSLVRRHVKSEYLKVKYYDLNGTDNNYISILYMDNICDKEVLEELNNRLGKIDNTKAVSINSVKEKLQDCKYTVFKTIGDTERPDVVARSLLEGRITILMDGAPTALFFPYSFKDNFINADDYTLNYAYATLNRALRYFGFIMSVIIPGLYVALVSYHQELLPLRIAKNVIIARLDVPFPIAIEIMTFLTIFEILREVEVKMSNVLGGAISIVGALIIGQSAISAKVVSPIAIIMVSFSAVTGLITQRLQSVNYFLKMFIVLMAFLMGIHGVIFSLLLLFIHLLKIKSFNKNYLSDILTFDIKRLIKTYIRKPSGGKKWNI